MNDAGLAAGEVPAEAVARLDRRAERRETSCGGGRMVWRLWGAGDPLVLLHGSFGAWSHWIRLIEPLAARYRVIAADLPGMGDSDDPPLPFTVESLAAIVSAGLDRVLPPPARFHFAGFSFGGIVGGHLCGRQTARVRTYTALGSNGLGLPFGERPPLAKPNRDMGPAEIEAVHRTNLAITMIGDPARIDALALHLQTQNTRRARIRSGTIPRTDTLAHQLRRLPAPIQGIWGERDQTAGPFLDDRRRLFQAIQPGAPFTVVPGAGHWVQFEAPEPTFAALTRFLEAHPIS